MEKEFDKSDKELFEPVSKEFNINLHIPKRRLTDTLVMIDIIINKYPNAKLNVEIIN